MASNSSGSLAPGASYTLGEYSFAIRSNYDSDEDVTGIAARCTKGGETAIGGIDISGQATIESWSVETNETEATVYATVNPLKINIPKSPVNSVVLESDGVRYSWAISSGYIVLISHNNATWYYGIYASASPNAIVTSNFPPPRGSAFGMVQSYTKDEKTVYYASADGGPWVQGSAAVPAPEYYYGKNYGEIAWHMIFDAELKPSSHIVARFPIDIREAGGGGWEDPGDTGYGTLHLIVTGAMSGRHNDPLASDEGAEMYSYVPAENAKEAWYGCGGDGGYGGGGGAGASTIIINEFPTSRAGNKELVANARRHGYGSGGGKGGNGGDGCILIYYSTPVLPNP